MPLLPIFALLGQSLIEPRDLPQVLVLFQLDSIPLKVGVLNAFFALSGQVLNGLFPLLVLGHFLLLVFKERDQMVILLSSSVKLIGHRPNLVF